MGLRALRSLCAPRSAWPLAVLRVAVCSIILISPEPQQALELAARPSELWLAPAGLAWFLPLFAWCAPKLWLVARILQASALLALFGLWTRVSLAVLALSFVLLFGGAQLSGAVLHDMHLLWFLLILLVSPSASVLSLDAWAEGGRWLSSVPSTAAALGTHFARVLLGLVYVFPGLHKLLDSGPAWAASDNLRHQLWLKWFQAGGHLPWPRIDHFNYPLAAAGVGVLLFELSFLPCLAWRKGRVLALSLGLCFHAMTQHFLYIPFASLWCCYVLLWDGPRALDVAPQPDHACRVSFSVWCLTLVGSLLVLLVAVQGARGDTQSWPFACYPSFSALAPSAIADLAVEVRSSSGSALLLREGPLPAPLDQPPNAGRTPAQWSRVWSLAGLYGAPVSPSRLSAFARELAQRQGNAAPTSGSIARFWLETYATDPERYGQPPLSRVRLLETTF